MRAINIEVHRLIESGIPDEKPVRKAILTMGHFPSDEAATKLIYLSLRNIQAKWKRAPKDWHAAKAQYLIHFGDRFTVAA